MPKFLVIYDVIHKFSRMADESKSYIKVNCDDKDEAERIAHDMVMIDYENAPYEFSSRQVYQLHDDE